ncbi:MAG: gluconate:H+ symporter [Chitinophagia bacterium]|jgi:Gnt-I system high-affinity gluconate transporter
MHLLIIVLAILIQIGLTIKRVNPFYSLLFVAIFTGISLGMRPDALLVSIEKGVGSTLGGLALILCLGAGFGKILELSGAAEQIANSLIKAFGIQHIQWAMLLTGFLVGLPMYYNAGFIILVPLVCAVGIRTGLPMLYLLIPMAASLSTTHCFLPPHPGPVVLVKALGADMGKTLLLGILVTIPAIIVAGPLLGRKLQNMQIPVPEFFIASNIPESERPSILSSFVIALLPILLITGAVLLRPFFSVGNKLGQWIGFLGDANIALFISVILAIYFLGIRKKSGLPILMDWMNKGISGIAMILMIITAGGVFKQVLIDSGTGNFIISISKQVSMPPILFAWLTTAILRVTLGSATVAGLTAAGLVGPLVTGGVIAPEIMVLAVGAGSVFGSHINDSGFWMFKEFFQLTLKQTFLSWTLMETIISIMGLLGVLILNSLLY